MPQDYAPLSLRTEDGALTGFMPELLDEIGRRTNTPITIHGDWWSNLVPDFRSGKLDAISHVSTTDSEFGNWDFSIAAVQIRGVAYTRTDRPPLESIADFLGKRIGVVPSSLAAANARAHGGWGAVIVEFPSLTALLEGVRNREVDAALLTSPVSLRVGDPGDLQKSLVDGVTHSLHFVFPPEQRAAMRRFNEAIAEAKRDGTYDQLFEKWIGPVERRPITLRDLKPYARRIAAGSFAIVAVVAIIVGLQRRSLARSLRHAAELAESRQRLEEANHQLEKAIAEAEQSAQRAEQANRSKSRFLATVSHEIRTPLNAVVGMTSALKHSRLDNEQRELVEMMECGADHLLHIIQDILDSASIEAGNLRLNSTEFDLEKTISSAVGMLAKQAAEKQLQLRVELSPRTPHLVYGDASRIKQVVLNFVGNAVKFTDKGSITVRTEITREDDAQLQFRITVRDTGPGIRPQTQTRLFQPFVQGDDSDSRRHGGAGLGLSISRQVIERMGGSVGLHSEPGKGSEFWLEVALPKSVPLAQAV